MVLEGPLIHHLEVSKQGFVLTILPFGKIQTRFCISCTTIWKEPNKVLYLLYYHLERSKQGFVFAVLPFGKIQTRFCISCTTIWKDPNKVLY